MVSNADIASRLTSVLRKADLATTTTTAIRQQLEQDLGVNLSDRKAFIRQQVDLYLQQQQQQQEEEEEEEEEEDNGKEAEEEEDENDDEVEDEEDEEDEENEVKPARARRNSEPDSKRLRAKIDRAIKDSLPKEKKKRSAGSGGLNKACGLSPELQAIIGETELPRTQVVKQLWVYIRGNNLQDPENKRKIICDDALRGLFGTDSTDMFKMNKLLSKHIWPLPPVVGAPGLSSDGARPRSGPSSRADGAEDDGEPKPKKQKTEKTEGGRRKNTGFLAPLPVSEGLAKFLGAEDGKVSRADAVKRVWDYIKENNLQDPEDKKMIVCDDRLQELFGCDTFVGFSITKLLSPHFLKS